MKRVLGVLAVVAGIAALALAGGQVVMAQAGPPPGGPGGHGDGRFDPAQMEQMMLQRFQEVLGATDSEWATLAPLVEKVMKLQQGTRMGGMGGPGGRGPRGGEAASTEATALGRILDSSDATDEQITAALSEFRSSRVAKQEELAKARETLRAAVSLRQEARLVLMGLLD